MAALSCYQPCREHIARPARCLTQEEEERITAASFSLRRRQYIERCHEARAAANRDLIPPEVSVKKTREELTKHASQTVNRRQNVESGWSKVEEVRKKFESSTTNPSYSRSFESPPRRRLADSLFASFKLPRKKEQADMAASRSMAQQPQQKRKSAVELLAETKAFYVKSETVLDRKQELPLRVSSGLGQAIAAGGCHLVSSGTLNNDACCNPYNVGSLGRMSGCRRAVSAGEGLQNTLRRLLQHTDSRERIYDAPNIAHKPYTENRRYAHPDMTRSQHTSGTFSGTSSSGTSGSKHRSDPEKVNRPLSFGDARVFFPESFVIPRQRPSEVVLKSTYSIPSSAEGTPPDGAPLSPPGAYAPPRYIRSNSHSQPSVRDDDGCNINSHKSLPDLHTQARCYTEHSERAGGETPGRSPRRRRGHLRAASCSSKGTRSNHSSLISCDAFSEHPSPGEENYHSYTSGASCGGCGWARSSGGSSGRYTHSTHGTHTHSTHGTHAAILRPHHDSGASTHHEHNSSGNAPWEWEGQNGEEWVVSAPPQFQDGAPPLPPHPPPPVRPPTVSIHFQASAPPPQFQDDPPMYDYRDYGDYERSYKTPVKTHGTPRKDAYSNTREYRYHEGTTELISKQPQYAEPRITRPKTADDTQEYVNATQVNTICGEEVTSPLGTFKRQRGLRYKRPPRPILRSKSDISDRPRRPEGRGPASVPDSPSPPSEGSIRLHQFFETLGLEARDFDALLHDSDSDTPVYFSSTTTVDSNHLPPSNDYTVQGPGVPKSAYRNTEPPSVVERNARIIKWLCQCRKTQIQPPT